jgi:small multidrug resistance family-3 protein
MTTSARKVRLTHDALRVVPDRVPTSPERQEALRRAFFAPKMFSELWQNWKADLPSDQTIINCLVLERRLKGQAPFSEQSAAGGHPMRFFIIWAFLLAATTLEAGGDAIVRNGLYTRTGFARLVMLAIGASLLLGYGVMLNLTPQPFERVVGLYIATLFIVWQTISFIAFGAVPSPPLLVGGAFIIIGGLIVTFWK